MMKTLSSYIDKMVGALAKQFPTAVIHYAFLEDEELHVVDLTGEAIDNLGAKDWAIIYSQWVNEFEAKFPGKSLLLVREGDFVRVTAEEAIKTIAPKTLAADIPNNGSVLYAWADKIGEYFYEVQSILPPLITVPHSTSHSAKATRKRQTHGSESVFVFDSVPATTGTESFCTCL